MRVEVQIPGVKGEVEIPPEVVSSPGYRVPCVGECLYGYKPETVHAVDDVVWHFAENTVTLILVELNL